MKLLRVPAAQFDFQMELAKKIKEQNDKFEKIRRDKFEIEMHELKQLTNGHLHKGSECDLSGGTLTFSRPITYDQTPPMYGFADIPHDPSLYDRMKEKLDGLFSVV